MSDPQPKSISPISNLQISNPLKISPSAPAHSAGPTQHAHNARPCGFQKTLAAAERADKKLSPQDLVKNLHQKCKLQHVFLLAFLFCFIIFAIVFKNVLPPPVGSTFLKNDSNQNAFKNGSLESLLGALAPSIPLRRALFHQYKCCSHEGFGHFFDLGPLCTHDLQFIFAISVIRFNVFFDFSCFST